MLTALLLAVIGLGDLARTHLRRRAALLAIPVLAAAAVTAALLVGAPPLGAAIVVVLAGAWLLTTTTVENARPPGGLRPAVALVAAVLVLTAVDRAVGVPTGPLAPTIVASALPPIEQLALAVGAGLFLLESGNVIVRAALFRELPQAEPAPRPRWSERFARREPADARLPDLQGGRTIGPLERLLIAGLTLAGAIGLAGAVLAAKGIVRFPEISRDGGSGEKAEYFLVGSLVSWALALGCAGLVAIAGR
ncbi:hypothetical protein C5C39_10820 [Rathayibacter sp. AY1F3]|uniref:hypothetical protein n=1 Tax=Rathayibacter sp. AY1F3 TaxID=2080558 RepID=UPI000CE730B2|nr:hypothetical protein [Rathayibacter sp. AY1F3]PPG89804.1 hypothetical protein C5C39_10820 [Rathayibacter sp. AY1F3]